jgi:hypothetical protein
VTFDEHVAVGSDAEGNRKQSGGKHVCFDETRAERLGERASRPHAAGVSPGAPNGDQARLYVPGTWWTGGRRHGGHFRLFIARW